MKKLFILALFVGGGYGFYRWLNSSTADMVADTIKNGSSQALENGKVAEQAAARATATAAVNSVQEAVNGFKAQEGRWPTSLQELVDRKIIDGIPPGVVYDPATGQVSAG